MTTGSGMALQLILGVILLWLAPGVTGVFVPRNLDFVSRVLFPTGATGPERRA